MTNHVQEFKKMPKKLVLGNDAGATEGTGVSSAAATQPLLDHSPMEADSVEQKMENVKAAASPTALAVSPTKKVDTHSRRRTVSVGLQIGLTFVFFLVELIVGIVNRSIALLADSYHMLADVMALVVALACLWISKRPSKKNGFGLVRAEVLGALTNGVFLLAISFIIVLESISRFINPRVISHPEQVLVVGAIGLGINIIGIFMFHGHAHGGGAHGHSHKPKQPLAHEEQNGNDKGAPRLEDEDKHTLKATRSYSTISDVCHNHLALRLLDIEEEELRDAEAAEVTLRNITDEANLNMQGVFLHIISDAVGSLIVITTAVIAFWFPVSLANLNRYLDPMLRFK